jgi:Cu(I)/Ag(I) efflux system membrane fusion protein
MTVSAGQTLAQVTSLATVWLNLAVPEAQAGLVHVGDTARLELTAFPGKTFTGQVTALLPTAQVDSRTLQARVELPNPGGRLRPGMFATAHLGGGARLSLLVPTDAVIATGRRNLVMLAGEKGRYQPVEVRVGREAGGQTEILQGLSAGQRVVASGQFLLDSEASLTGVETRPLAPAPR